MSALFADFQRVLVECQSARGCVLSPLPPGGRGFHRGPTAKLPNYHCSEDLSLTGDILFLLELLTVTVCHQIFCLCKR